MLINLSNHPSGRWSKEQTDAATAQFGGVVDYMFPNVNPNATAEQISDLADQVVSDIQSLTYQNIVIHVMGEMTLTYALVKRFTQLGIPCVASTTERIVNELPDGKKEVLFHFVQFRKY